jgi:hypothetical protein
MISFCIRPSSKIFLAQHGKVAQRHPRNKVIAQGKNDSKIKKKICGIKKILYIFSFLI